MLNEEICKLREELNNSILEGRDYGITYELSIRLDKLIAEYYKIELENNTKPKIKNSKIKKKLIYY